MMAAAVVMQCAWRRYTARMVAWERYLALRFLQDQMRTWLSRPPALKRRTSRDLGKVSKGGVVDDSGKRARHHSGSPPCVRQPPQLWDEDDW